MSFYDVAGLQPRPRSATVQWLDMMLESARTRGVQMTQEQMIEALQLMRDELHRMEGLMDRLRARDGLAH